MLSVLEVLLLVLSASPASTSPVRRWLNTSSSDATFSSTEPIWLPLSTAPTVDQAAADVAYTSTADDDCEDMSTAAMDASPTWPAALSTVRTSVSIADGAYAGSQTAPAATQQHQQASTPVAYTSEASQSISTASIANAPPPYTVTSAGRHANTTAPAPSGYGKARPYASSSLSGTTTLTLYTTVGSGAGSAPSASDTYAGDDTGVSASREASSYGGQTTSMAAYTNPASSSTVKTRTRGHPAGPDSSQVAYSSPSAPAFSSSNVLSSYAEQTTRTRHRPTRPTHHASSDATSQVAQYSSTTTQAVSSLPPAYPSSVVSSSETSSVVIDPIPTSYNTPSQPYSYAPRTSTTLPAAGPPVPPTSQAYPGPQQSYGGDVPWLPTVVTESPSATETTTSTSSYSTSTSTSMGGITIVPMDPDAETVYVTVTTTEAGKTTTVAGPTVTEYA